MNWNDERTFDEVEAGIVSPERSGGIEAGRGTNLP
jgi:hypothetical protein